MAGYVMHPVQQSPQDRADFSDGERAIVGSRLVELMGVAPFPIGRKNRRQPRHAATMMREAGCIGVSQPLRDIEPDMASVPIVRKADIKEVGG